MDKLNNQHPLIGHATTFGGHPVSCVSALESLKVLMEEDLMAKEIKKANITKLTNKS